MHDPFQVANGERARRRQEPTGIAKRNLAMSLAHVGWKGWAALATFALQNGAAVLIMRASKTFTAPYSSQVAVLMQELVVKLPVCTILYALECGGLLTALRSITNDLRERPTEWAQLAVPAVLYTIQNTMLYVGFANVEAAVGQITYQSKILWTAMFSIMLLGKQLTTNQWISLVVLAFGVLAVQSVEEPASDKGRGNHARRHSKVNGHGKSAGHEQNPMLGVGALVLAALCTAFASVYFEKMLKGASKPSLWLRNIQVQSRPLDARGWLPWRNTRPACPACPDCPACPAPPAPH